MPQKQAVSDRVSALKLESFLWQQNKSYVKHIPGARSGGVPASIEGPARLTFRCNGAVRGGAWHSRLSGPEKRQTRLIADPAAAAARQI